MNFKSHILYIIIIGIVLLVLFKVVSYAKKLHDEIGRKDSIIEEKVDSIHYHINEYNHVVGEKIAAVATNKELIKAYPDLVSEIRREFDIKAKEIRAIVRNEFAAHGQGNSTINNHYYTDSTGVQRSSWDLIASDGYLNFRATVIDSTSAPYKYNYSDTAITVISARKKWILGSEKLYSSTVFKNPNARINAGTSVLINNHRDKRWVISAGVSYLPLKYGESWAEQIQPSITIGYALFKF